MSDVRYCAVGDYGVEADFPTQRQCEEWIADQIEESRRSTNWPLEDDYYKIKTYTQAELDAMPEE